MQNRSLFSRLWFLFLFVFTLPLPILGQNSIFTTQVPTGEYFDGPYELGTKFTVSKVARIKAIKYYKMPGETGTHVGRIWDFWGRQLGAFTFTDETASGWQTVEVTNNYEIYPENIFWVSVNSNTSYAATPAGLANQITNGIISSVADGANGVYGAPGEFPTNTYNNNNYFRDVVVEEVLNPWVPPIELSWPVSGAQLYSNSAQFAWYLPWGMGVGFYFDLLLSTDPTMATYTEYNPGSNNTFTVNGLQAGTIYYWRVRVHNVVGWHFNTSVIESFVTPPAASIPVAIPSWPVDNATAYTLAPTLFWYHNDAAFGLNYEVEVREGGPGNLTGTANFLPTPNRYLQLTGLLPGTQYSWAVRSSRAGGFSAWSAPQSFTTHNVANVVIPTPSWPVDDAEIYTTSPNLYWYLGSDGTGLTYEVEVVEGAATAFTGTPTIINIAALTTQLAGLYNGTVYKWKVRSVRGTARSDWSAAAQFHTVAVVPDPVPVVPTLSWPIDNATVYSTAVTLNWWLGVATDGYTYEVELRPGALTGTPTILNIPSNSYNVPILLAGTTYNWQARSLKGGVYSDWSEIESFTTISGTVTADIPVPSWPVGANTVYSTNQRLLWYMNSPSAGLTFNLRYGHSPTMENPTVVPGLTNMYYDLTNMPLGTIYYWQVQSTNGTVTSDWSTNATFVTWSGTWAVVPVTGSPVNGVQLTTNAPVLSWFIPTSGNIAGYEVQYSDNPSFNNAVAQQVSGTNFTVNSALQHKPYYWRVRSKNGNGDFSVYSSLASFVPASPTGVEETIVPSEFALYQNYPNPFNPATTIRFSVPRESFVTLKVYDNTGTLVTTLVKESVSAGDHTVSFNASGLASGIYFYRLESEGVAISKKMLLLK